MWGENYEVGSLTEYLRKKFPKAYQPDTCTWQVTLHEGKDYIEKFQRHVIVSQACLESTWNKAEDGPVSVMIQRNNDAKALFCTFNSDDLQKSLSTDIYKGEEVTFSIEGKGIVHLTGLNIYENHDDEGCTREDLAQASFLFFENLRKEHPEEWGYKKSKKPGLVKDSKKSGVEIEDEDDIEDGAKAYGW